MDEVEEIWKDIPGYEGLYQVSNMGRVKSLSRVVYGGFGPRFQKDRYLKNSKLKCGYNMVTLCNNGKELDFGVHRLVAFAFLGLNVNSGRSVDVNHIDGVKDNNVLTNLEIVTHRENCSTCFRKNSDKHTSKYPGVYYYKARSNWASEITINRKKKFIGYFKTEEEAYVAYKITLDRHMNK